MPVPIDAPVADPVVPPAPAPAPAPKPTAIDPPVADPAPTDPPKPADGDNSAIRQIRDQNKKLETELAAYKRREDEARKAKLTEEERLREESTLLKAENERLKAEHLQGKIAAEYGLPAALAGRLIGSDEASLRADAEDLARLLPPKKVGTTSNPPRDTVTAKTYSRADLARDPRLAASPEVRQAAREGRVTA